jgi:hypothetical protein
MIGPEIGRLLKFLFGSPLTLRGTSLGQILRGKIGKRLVRRAVGIDNKTSSEPHPAFLKLSFLNAIAKMAELEKEAPFKSEAQRRKFYAMENRGEISKTDLRKWESETPKGKKLPERIHRKAAGEKFALLQHLPWLTMVPGKKAVSRVARGAGWAGVVGIPAIEGAKAGPVSFERTSLAVDRLLEITKESVMFQTLGRRATANAGSHVGGKVHGEAQTKPRAASGAFSSEAPSTDGSGGGSHIARPSI